ncbi:PREDICTED: uncharacterized protein LOC108371861 [Rhagoletis zephyria]|uniref:uncharacterized protein LOC108371861 n=1 Tax=Rhagoletis zephyria TaxID=28612 RepID=UPI0008112759|nr:PREDICTED: uncharacterized protein LOC108371861 [Rhagoletis zephyria]XP_036320625.1 uncharacterized protein LOC118735113 isoform X1 [Rhagoletis pomonella]
MGRRKSKRKPPPKKKNIEPLDQQFNCPFCNHEKSCEVKIFSGTCPKIIQKSWEGYRVSTLIIICKRKLTFLIHSKVVCKKHCVRFDEFQIIVVILRGTTAEQVKYSGR